MLFCAASLAKNQSGTEREIVLVSASIARDKYQIATPGLLTPALAIYADFLDENIRAMLKLLGSPNHWRPHIKTAKLAFTVSRLVEHGVVNLKCATTLELLTACEAGAQDVLIAYPLIDPAVERVAEIASRFPAVQISGMVEDATQVEFWQGKKAAGLFLDVNSGMNRTGIDSSRLDEIVKIARAVAEAGHRFRGVHYYEGNHIEPNLRKRIASAHRGYLKLLKVISALEDSGILVEEVVTSGTPALPCALAFDGFRKRRFLHRVSPGTLVYNDFTSIGQLPREYGFKLAALVIATVVSKPTRDLVTCDAGYKSVSADAGIPTCLVHNHGRLRPAVPSEEHLPIKVTAGMASPKRGDQLYLVPRHICPTVNNFDSALIITGGKVSGVERVTARGHEMLPLALGAETS